MLLLWLLDVLGTGGIGRDPTLDGDNEKLVTCCDNGRWGGLSNAVHERWGWKLETHLFAGGDWLLGHLLDASAGASFGRKIYPNIHKHHYTAGDVKRSQGRVEYVTQVFAKLQVDGEKRLLVTVAAWYTER